MATRKENFPRFIATDAQRLMAARIAEEKDREKEAKRQAKIAHEELVKSLGGAVDVVLITEDGTEVATATLIAPEKGSIDWAAFQTENAWLADEIEKYRKPAPEPTTRINTTWREVAAATARGAFQGIHRLLSR